MTSTTAIAIAADYQNLLQLLESSDDLTPEMIADTLEGMEGELADKLDSIMVIARNNLGNADLLPDELVNTQVVISPDKKAIKEAIESAQAAAAQITADGGEIPEELLNPVPGAHLEIGERSLQVR